jgi:hypothetical protein
VSVGRQGKDRRPRRSARPRRRPQAVGRRLRATVDSARRIRWQPLARAALAALVDVISIVKEAVAIPVQIWLGLAERAGAFVLVAWRRVLAPILLAAYAVIEAGLRWAMRELTPARMVAAVICAAVAALFISQFVDYRAVEVGAPQYSGLSNVAPAPEVASGVSTSAHGVAVFALAVVALPLVAAALRGKWRVARLLIVVGVAVVAISLIVDAPQGLDEGRAALAYEGAKATLLGGFWAQLSAGAVLCVCGPLLAAYLSPQQRSRRWVSRFSQPGRLERAVRSAGRRAWSSRPWSRVRSRVQGART